jgi:uncharacterized membrane protein
VVDSYSKRKSTKRQNEHDSLILSRMNTRESSTLTFATVAASASLVVLALTIERHLEMPFYLWLQLIGLVFAILGFAYREITDRSFDVAERSLLSLELWSLLMSRRDTTLQRLATHTRRFMVRILLLLPIVAWLIVIANLESSFVDMGFLAVAFAFLALLLDKFYPESKTPIDRKRRSDT